MSRNRCNLVVSCKFKLETYLFHVRISISLSNDQIEVIYTFFATRDLEKFIVSKTKWMISFIRPAARKFVSCVWPGRKKA